MEGFAEFVEDIRRNGQRVPIWVQDGEVIEDRINGTVATSNVYQNLIPLGTTSS